jgi:hypothetical protein
MTTGDRERAWPAIPFEPWRETCATLHRLTQLVGKVRLACTPWINHSWHVALYLTARGLTTGPMAHGDRVFQLDFDFVDHRLVLTEAGGGRRAIELGPTSIAAFHQQLQRELAAQGLAVEIVPTPNEIAGTPPLDRDRLERPYDRDAVNRFWRALASSDRVLRRFRSRFVGKCSPVHFFWGSFDLAVTRFSGRGAPVHPGGVPRLPDAVAREAYSHEVSSAGFWPGTPGGPVADPAFYSYAYPAPEGLAQARVRPDAAYFHAGLGEFVLPYDVVRTAPSPDDVLLEFLQSTYAAAADLGRWDRKALERSEGPPAGIGRLSAPAAAQPPRPSR